MKRRLLLNVVVAEGTAVLELFAGKDQTLLIGRDALLVLNLRLDIVNGVRRLDIEGDGLSGEGLDKNLWKSTGQWRWRVETTAEKRTTAASALEDGELTCMVDGLLE